MGHPQIAAFARLANGSAKPVRSIAGQNTQFTRTIHDMAYDSVRRLLYLTFTHLDVIVVDTVTGATTVLPGQ